MDKKRENEIRQQIDAYVKGQLEEEEIQELWKEFAKNPHLLDILDIEVQVKSLIQEEVFGKSSKKTKINRLPSWTWHAVAAAVILCVAWLQFFRVNTPTEIEQFVVQQISPDQVETADSFRAEEMAITTPDSLLNLGFEAVLSSNEERAMQLFDEVVANYSEEPYGSKAFLNRGIVFYNKSDFVLAIEAFREAADRVEGNRMVSEKANWYLGNALVKTGDLEQARESIYAAYQLEGMFREAAFLLLKKISDDLGDPGYEEFDATELE